tara:strand:+ start:649 stop:876 length:228 start_codon:yes stop_codon:yes gene_type:complete
MGKLEEALSMLEDLNCRYDIKQINNQQILNNMPNELIADRLLRLDKEENGTEFIGRVVQRIREELTEELRRRDVG